MADFILVYFEIASGPGQYSSLLLPKMAVSALVVVEIAYVRDAVAGNQPRWLRRRR